MTSAQPYRFNQAVAAPTNNPLSLQGETTRLPAYKIEGYNWLKLRDIAKIFSVNQGRFALTNDADGRMTVIMSNKSYAQTGDEMAALDGKTKNAVSSIQRVTADGVPTDLVCYNVDGFIYFKLADIGKLLGLTFQLGDDGFIYIKTE